MRTLLFFCYLLSPVPTFDFGDTLSEMIQPEIQLKETSADFLNSRLNNNSIPDYLNLLRAVDYQEDYPFDSRLIGSYSITDYYNSGDFSRVKSTKLEVDSFGKVTIFEPEIFVSGSGIGMRSETSPVIKVQFKIYTRMGNMYVDHHQTQERTFVCKYSVDENAMVWIFEDGERIIWRR